MPSQSTLFNIKMEPIYEFGSAHRNTISWSPHGRFLCIAGFGNLAGEMDFYDVLRLRKIGSNSAHAAVSHSWSSDSRHFLTATLSPRMNVDNGLKIFKYNGIGPVVAKSFDVAYDVVWKPVQAGIYPARGPSPKREDAPVHVAIPAAKEVYRPPAYRAPGTSLTAFGDLLKKDSGPTGKIKSASQPPPSPAPGARPAANAKPQRVIPGMARPQPEPTKNTKPSEPSSKKKASSSDAPSSTSAPPMAGK
jgi:translation initiation factor 2A